jgi:hypothetical protein
MNQGQKANFAGNEAEHIIAGILNRKGCGVKRQAVVCHGIYNTPVKVDFLVYGIPEFDDGLIIECKWQSTSGSVDEKFPYLVLNIQKCYPMPAIIVLSGGGYRPGAEKWLKSQVGGNLHAVLNIDEFLAWVLNLEDTGIQQRRLA